MNSIIKIITMLFLISVGASAFDYSGTWINSSSNNLVPKIIVKRDGTIRAFGKCTPNDCDWGVTNYTKVKNGILASWKSGNFGHKVLLLQPVRNDRIRVVLKSLYCDNRPDKLKVLFFKKVPAVSDPSVKFIGRWVNENPNTRGVTRFNIFKNNGQLYVHVWGKCTPQDCDWGSARANLNGNDLKVFWNEDFVNREMTIKGVSYANGRFNRLQMKTVNVYNDNRGRRTDVEYFQRN